MVTTEVTNAGGRGGVAPLQRAKGSGGESLCFKSTVESPPVGLPTVTEDPLRSIV